MKINLIDLLRINSIGINNLNLSHFPYKTLSKAYKKFFTIGFLLFFSCSASLLAQQSYEECIEIERLKAKNDGANFSESFEYAKEICGNKNQQNSTSTNTINKIDNNFTNNEGFFVSLSVLPIASLSTTVKVGDITTRAEEDGSGLSPKIGYKLKNAQIHFSIYNFTADDFRYAFIITGVDYINDNGFLAGIGLGSGSVVTNGTRCANCPGPASAINIGYKNIKSKGLTWGVHIASAGFTESENITRNAIGLALDIGYLF